MIFFEFFKRSKAIDRTRIEVLELSLEKMSSLNKCMKHELKLCSISAKDAELDQKAELSEAKQKLRTAEMKLKVSNATYKHLKDSLSSASGSDREVLLEVEAKENEALLTEIQEAANEQEIETDFMRTKLKHTANFLSTLLLVPNMEAYLKISIRSQRDYLERDDEK